MAVTTFRAFLLLTSLPETGKQLTGLVKAAVDWWSGKKIAVIGPTASGKDSFLARLQNQEIPRVHANSTIGEKVTSFPVKLALSNRQMVDITCKGVINIGGETDYRDDPSGWLAVCEDADVVFYMMTVNDLSARRFLKGRRVRDDLDWLLTAMPHLKPGALVHILINKIDLEIESHTDYRALGIELKRELSALDRTVRTVLHPYESRYTGATLISMKNKQIYTRAINLVFRAVYTAFHETARRRKAG
ncbi:MAG TPA: GTPase domain-containing protein [Bryobacteraceae bacterium]|nr:GTPase domain-containing protein [Bryobacteraceae bacterium]